MKPNNVYSLRFKLEVFIWRHWRHVVYLPTSSITFRGIVSVFNRVCINHNTTRDVTTTQHSCVKIVLAGKNW